MGGCYKCKEVLMSYVTACTSIHQKAFEQGASNVYLCVVAAAFADGGACVLVLWRWFRLLALGIPCAGTEILHGMNCPCPGEEAVAALLGATAA